MKKIIISLMFLFSIGIIKANPITPPPIISEFYLVNDSIWYLELCFNPTFNYDTILDGYQITTSFGTALFKNGIHITQGSIIVITQDSLQTLLKIFRTGDFINIEKTIFSDTYLIDGISFGSNLTYSISSPIAGQSIVNQTYSCWSFMLGQFETNYRLVKENIPSIGINAHQATDFMGTCKGKVFDLMHNPISGILISNNHDFYYAGMGACEIEFDHGVTDTSGKFNVYLKSGKQLIQLFTTSSLLLDTIVFIEPDSLNYYEFTLDTLLNRVVLMSINQNFSLSCFPNPSNGKTAISFELPDNTHNSNTLIKIYNSTGEMIRILPVDISGKQNKYSVEWDGKCYNKTVASGVYYYNLELDGKKVATNKLIITK
ncbi:MAG: T9SS type A sorting domain-containing protein [Bacteroidia bacterium]|nr:T9SS type A sorting domain-containing protein [Bacteroidia bacterium]